MGNTKTLQRGEGTTATSEMAKKQPQNEVVTDTSEMAKEQPQMESPKWPKYDDMDYREITRPRTAPPKMDNTCLPKRVTASSVVDNTSRDVTVPSNINNTSLDVAEKTPNVKTLDLEVVNEFNTIEETFGDDSLEAKAKEAIQAVNVAISSVNRNIDVVGKEEAQEIVEELKKGVMKMSVTMGYIIRRNRALKMESDAQRKEIALLQSRVARLSIENVCMTARAQDLTEELTKKSKQLETVLSRFKTIANK